VLRGYSAELEFVSIHTPSELTISDAVDENYRMRGLACLERAVRLAAEVNCRRVVFHAFHNVTELGTIKNMVALRDRALQKCVEGIRSLNHLLENLDVVLCMENINACLYLDRLLYPIFTASPHDLLRVIKESGSDHLRLCFDIAHAQNACNFLLQNPRMRAFFGVSKLTVKEFCEMIIDHIDLVHLSDAKGVIARRDADNLPLGMGEIDFRKVLEPILVRKRRPPIVLETNEIDVNNAMNMVKAREFLSRIMAQIGVI